MGSVDAFEDGIRSQPAMMRRFRPQEPLRRLRGCAFTGNGDSLAAALVAGALSGGEARAADPDETLAGRPPARLYCISVSGRTAACVRAARHAESTAVTADPSSPLARACGSVIRIGGPGPVHTAGSATFLESALACASLVSRFRVPDGARLLAAAERDAEGAGITGSLFVLGSGASYPLAMYCAAKFYEVLGDGARYCRTEQFYHMELFCARPGDTVLMLDGPDGHGEALRRGGIRVVAPRPPRGAVPGIIYRAMYSQVLALREARRRDVRDCYFATSRAKRASDRAIYCKV
ncbi:conserved hypothetical protein [Nitrosopumilaceae archaeon]|nr:sugar isomerase [Nitrosopumilus sp.]CAI9832791.1 conserved hypothetical protein [Nitrosopumilaceae archaeon]MDA7944387.1 sugar isomerase [Nitrosopumilus sp.]MDA7954139.1 sugar isomerase [Nitrosopumilus sp.]MDA7973067.1 sugar isomerase [Nitrosopumilus sp.]